MHLIGGLHLHNNIITLGCAHNYINAHAPLRHHAFCPIHGDDFWFVLDSRQTNKIPYAPLVTSSAKTHRQVSDPIIRKKSIRLGTYPNCSDAAQKGKRKELKRVSAELIKFPTHPPSNTFRKNLWGKYLNTSTAKKFIRVGRYPPCSDAEKKGKRNRIIWVSPHPIGILADGPVCLQFPNTDFLLLGGFLCVILLEG